MLAAGLIRDNLQAHLAPARVGEQPPSSTPTSLPVRTKRESAATSKGRLPTARGTMRKSRRAGHPLLPPGCSWPWHPESRYVRTAATSAAGTMLLLAIAGKHGHGSAIGAVRPRARAAQGRGAHAPLPRRGGALDRRDRPAGLDGRRRPSRHTFMTRLTLTKGPTQASVRRAPCTAPPAQSRPGPRGRTHAAMAWRRQPGARSRPALERTPTFVDGRERSVCGAGLNAGVHATPLEEE